MATETIDGLIYQVIKKIKMNQSWIEELFKEKGNKKRWLKLVELCPEISFWPLFIQSELICALNKAFGKVFS